MTISTEVRKAGPFIGNDSASVFPFAFKVFKAADLIVVRRQDNIGEETTLVLDSDYHVTLNGNQDTTPGGVVTLVGGALASGFTLVVSSELPYLQPTDLTNQGGFYPKVITNALDRLTIFCQQLAEITGRTLKLPITAPTNISAEIPLPNPSELIAWDETGTKLTTISPQSLVTSIAYGSATADLFAGDGGTTTFPLSTNPASVNNLDVSIDGHSQRPVQGGIGDYSWNGGASITFAEPPPAPSIPGDKNVLVRYMQAIPVSDSEALHAQTREALRRSYADAGYNLVDGSFETGGTLTSTNDVLLLESAGTAYAWTGVYPVGGYVVAPGIDPTLPGSGYVPRTDVVLRVQLAEIDGANLVGGATYHQIRAYSGDATSINCIGRAANNDGGEGDFFVDENDTTSPDDDGVVLVDALGRRRKRNFSGSLNFRWYGGVDDYDVDTGMGTDNLPALQNALKSMAWNKKISRALFIPGRDYYFSGELSLLSTITTGNLQGCKIEGDARTTEFQKGTMLYFAGGKVGINTAGTDGVMLENIGIGRAKVNGARLGLLQARTQGANQTGWAGDQRHINLFINMGSDTSYPDGLGTIAYVNLGGEETALESPQFWANTPAIFTSNSAVLASNDTIGLSNKTLDLTALTTAMLATGASNTVFEIYGLGRFVAYDYVSPCCLVNNAATLRLGHTFMQKRLTGTPGVTVGANAWALETWNCFGFEHFGAIENAEFYHLQRRAFADFDVNVVLNSYSLSPRAAWLMVDDGGTYVTERGSLIVRNNNPARPLAISRGDGNATSNVNFTVRNVDYKYSLNSFDQYIDKRSVKALKSVRMQFNDAPVCYKSGEICTDVAEKNIGNSASAPVKLFDVYLPTYANGAGSVGISVQIDGQVTNASKSGGGVEGGVSAMAFTSKFSAARLHSSTAITVGAVTTELVDAGSSLPGGNDLTALSITTSPVDASGIIGVYAHATEAGANQATVYLTADVSVRWAGGSYDGVIVL